MRSRTACRRCTRTAARGKAQPVDGFGSGQAAGPSSTGHRRWDPTRLLAYPDFVVCGLWAHIPAFSRDPNCASIPRVAHGQRQGSKSGIATTCGR